MDTYDVEVRRGDQWWVLRVPAIQAAVSQAKSLRDVESTAQDLIAVMLDVPADSFGVAVHVSLPDDVQEHLTVASELRKKAASAQSDAAFHVRLAALGMKNDGMSLRDIGESLGVSYQRAHQLVSR